VGQSTPHAEFPSVELAAVPFFPQTRYQCGPAALATVLSFSGVAAEVEALAEQVYVPGRKGSFQFELKAAARRLGRIPYELDGGLESLTAEVAAGRPVLVLQNLGLGWLPTWHYAVVVGFEPESRRVILRSGRQERRLENSERFLRRWSLAERWAMVVLFPGEVPQTGSPERYLQALVDSAAALPRDDRIRSLEAGLMVWPNDPDLNFAGGNLAREAGSLEKAETYYRRTLAAAPRHLGALNNYADLLFAQGCYAAARTQIEKALAAAPSESPLRPLLERTRMEIEQVSDDTVAEDANRCTAAP
jgi:tetratricopeptide (TPR) repeat protein